MTHAVDFRSPETACHDPRDSIVVLGIGNLLWADEGFGVRAVEALHAGWQWPAEVLGLSGSGMKTRVSKSNSPGRQSRTMRSFKCSTHVWARFGFGSVSAEESARITSLIGQAPA